MFLENKAIASTVIAGNANTHTHSYICIHTHINTYYIRYEVNQRRVPQVVDRRSPRYMYIYINIYTVK